VNDARAGEDEDGDEEEGDNQPDTVLEGGKMDEAAIKQEREHLRYVGCYYMISNSVADSGKACCWMLSTVNKRIDMMFGDVSG